MRDELSADSSLMRFVVYISAKDGLDQVFGISERDCVWLVGRLNPPVCGTASSFRPAFHPFLALTD